MKSLLLPLIFCLCSIISPLYLQAQTTYYRHEVGIDLLVGMVAATGRYSDDIGFEFFYNRLSENGKLRMKVGTNTEKYYSDGNTIYSYTYDENCVEKRRMVNFYVQNVNYKGSIGYAWNMNVDGLSLYYGSDLGVGFNRSFTSVNYENCYSDPHENDQSRYEEIQKFPNTLFQIEMIPFLGTELHLRKNISILLEFGAIFNFFIGDVKYMDEEFNEHRIKNNNFRLSNRFLNDLALVYKF